MKANHRIIIKPKLSGSATLRRAVLRRLEEIDFLAYQAIIRQMLQRCGYESVSLAGSVFRQGRNSAGGYELCASTQTDLALSQTLVQLKQYRIAVSRRYVYQLKGAVLSEGAEQGLLITTSVFSRFARAAAVAAGK